MDRYEPQNFEQKWRDRWLESDLFLTREDADRPKFYGLDFFPYPSGAGLSVGHCRNFIPTDVICRMKYMQGHNVLHPMGFDAFGLPAENEAIKRKRHPGPMIADYAATYRRQMELIGISYDWSRSFSSSDPEYYRWTQWIFKLLYERGLAERRLADINWCPKDMTALANEEVVGGLCERCGTPVEKRAIPQWFFKITDYAQRLIDDLDTIDWPEGIKALQRNWIGRSEGVEFAMEVELPEADAEPSGGLEVVSKAKKPTFRVFTTRIDTIYGMTFCVLAPEHPLVAKIKASVSEEKAEEISAYQQKARETSDIDRQAVNRTKTGVNTGVVAINPANGKGVPVFIADYVLMGYGTGAIMAVPGHDERDFEFAQTFGLDVIPVITEVENQQPETLPYPAKDGWLINSGSYTGMTVKDAQTALSEWVESIEIGERKINYKLRDWLISRQRYWGCPIPIVYDKEGNMEAVSDSALPVLLPDVENYEPSDDGSSPLARIDDFVNCTTNDGTLGRRETDTMGGFACSSWYFLRFCDPHNSEKPFDLEKVKAWMPVDCYVGGAEHAVMHLLYARFWTKVLYDAGLVDFQEPFARLMNQGQVLAQAPYRQPREDEHLDVGEDGILVSFEEAAKMNQDELTWKWVRMSKSKGNVVTPDEAVAQYGADALRIFELFVAPFEQAVNWTNEGMQGTVRFLSRFCRLAADLQPYFQGNWKMEIDLYEPTETSRAIRRATHQTIRKATEDIERFAFNTYVSSMMVMVNNLNDAVKTLDKNSNADLMAASEALQTMILLIAPAAPHTADELWEQLGFDGFTYTEDWPIFSEELAKDDTVTIAVQVNGKLRDTLQTPADATQEVVHESALKCDKVLAQIEGKTVRKVIFVPGKLLNIVAN